MMMEGGTRKSKVGFGLEYGIFVFNGLPFLLFRLDTHHSPFIVFYFYFPTSFLPFVGV